LDEFDLEHREEFVQCLTGMAEHAPKWEKLSWWAAVKCSRAFSFNSSLSPFVEADLALTAGTLLMEWS
jgi:hypothetical protein